MRSFRKLLQIAALTLAVPFGALAHDNATLDRMPSPHGGQVRMAGPYHLELVLGQTLNMREVKVYITDHGNNAIEANGVVGKVIFTDVGGSTNVTLAATRGNVVSGKANFSSDPSLKINITLQFKDGSAWEAEFTPFAPKPAVSITEPTSSVVAGNDQYAENCAADYRIKFYSTH